MRGVRLHSICVAEVVLLSHLSVLKLLESALLNHGGIPVFDQLGREWLVYLSLSDFIDLLDFQLLDPEELRNG